MIITERDRNIINYIERVEYATTKNIAEIFFNNGSKNYYIVALRRLNKLVEYGKINSMSANIRKNGRPMTLYFIYKKPKNNNLKHALALADLSAELSKNEVDIISIEREVYITEKIRCDAIYKVNYNDKKRLFVVEFDITKKFNTTKYEYLKKSNEWKDYFKKFPRIVSVSDDKPYDSREVKIIHLNSSLDNINILLKDII